MPTVVTDTVRVLIVDDSPSFREGMAALLGTVDGIALAGEARTGEEGIGRAC